ncbi:hypothetical protein CONPUDRAFT_91772 [Coniophora puteana RWD-64-598 SS2]|uniref:Uncharacterized protein n=1 Tax=Coniophora puteana (strain RWD-64-598) TaxID=741705 RepID=A0A5M3MHN2_CONPW|nr:uncharacterized protein CONPUDRAFT_91772 [Coniophora puteana RWD-64-598 SS2]EIW78294.1 hypothetical protein CONPUDRAFT_91772 [Coniophora puteana RWD-64-598 SS2]
MSFPTVAAAPYFDDEELRSLERLRALTNGSNDKVEILRSSADLMQNLERKLEFLANDNQRLLKESEEVSARNQRLLAMTKVGPGAVLAKKREAK